MKILMLLAQVDFVVTVAVNSAVLCFSFVAYRRTQARAFACWIVACALCLLSTIAARTYGHAGRGTPEDYQDFLEFFRLASIVQVALWGAGSLMLIREWLATLSTATAPKALQPIAAPLQSLGTADTGVRLTKDEPGSLT